MAKWKKIAEAFGRAMDERMKEGKTSKIINSSEIAKKANSEGIYENNNAVQAYRRGQKEGGENFYIGRDRATDNAVNNMDPATKRTYEKHDFDFALGYGPDNAYHRAVELSDRPRKSDISRQISRVEDENSSQRLQDEFDKAFDDIVERRKEDRLNEWDWDGKPENQMGDDWDYRAAKDRDDVAEQQVRDELIKELKSGIPLSDFFEKYRR